MDAFITFIHMGGYAGYVWSSYGIALVIFVMSIVSPVLEKRKLEKRIQGIIENEQSSRQKHQRKKQVVEEE